MLRDRIEAATPRPEIEKMRQQARRSIEPVLSPTNPEPLIVNLINTSLREILSLHRQRTAASTSRSIAISRIGAITLTLEGVSLEQALQQIMISNQLFYKVVNERTIIVANENAQKRQQYEDQVIRTFFISNADATELQALLNTLLRVAGMAIQPQVVANKTANTITMRATAPVVQIAERVIEANDRPRAEVVVEVTILEVSRERAKRYGLDLGSYSASLAFSPESAPSDSGKPINLNTISQGVSTADFYFSVPSAVVRFLESDSQTKVLAKPNLRGTEGQKLSLNLGEDVPVPSTTFTPNFTGGSASNPLVSFAYRPIGINLELTPRVTYDGDVILEITVENSSRGQDLLVGEQNLPSFFSRKVITKLRLRDGESNLLAGLLREDERRSLRGFPGVMRLPIVKQLFSDNDKNIRQTDIVMLLTPRIVRTHELRASDLSPIYIGTSNNMSLGGPPAVMGGEPLPPAPADVAPSPAAPSTPGVAPSPATGQPIGTTPAATPRPVVPPGSSTIPGLTTMPVAAPPPVAAPSVVVPPEPEPPPVVSAPPAPAPAPPAAATSPAAAGQQVPARITLSPPSEMRIGSGPYTVPISIAAASRLSTLTISVTYNPALIRIRSVQEGTFMRQGGVAPVFSSQVDEKSGRVDIVISRPGDQTGASTAGLLAALLVEPVAAGTGSLSISGSASVPGGASAALQYLPAGITVR